MGRRPQMAGGVLLRYCVQGQRQGLPCGSAAAAAQAGTRALASLAAAEATQHRPRPDPPRAPSPQHSLAVVHPVLEGVPLGVGLRVFGVGWGRGVKTFIGNGVISHNAGAGRRRVQHRHSAMGAGGAPVLDPNLAHGSTRLRHPSIPALADPPQPPFCARTSPRTHAHTRTASPPHPEVGVVGEGLGHLVEVQSLGLAAGLLSAHPGGAG